MGALSDRLAAARAEALIGREPERAALDHALSGAPDAPFVVYLHGPGGIGKSSLLRHVARQAELAGRAVLHLDVRFLDGEPRRLEQAAASARVQPGIVLLLDSFEHGQPLEAWLRDTFLPGLADDALVVVASRVAPDPEWTLDPGWAPLFRELVVRPLGPTESDALLAARGVDPEQRSALVAFSGGSPLALSLAASVPASGPGAAWTPTGDVLATLVDRLVGDLPSPAHQRALEVVAQAYVTRETLLRLVLPDEDGGPVFRWLRQLPYVEATAEGLHPHDAVRATLQADLRWRDPERYEDVRVRLSVAALQAVRSASEDDALLRVAEWMYLFRDQGVVPDLYDWDAHPHVHDAPLLPGDELEVLRLAGEAEGPESTRAVAHWLVRQPESFRVYRYPGSTAPIAFMANLQLDAALAEDRAADPVIAALWEHVETVAPLATGEHLGIRRFAVQPGAHQQPSPVMDLISRRTIADEMRAVRRAVTFTVFEDADRWGPYLAGARLQEVAAVEVDGRTQHVFGRDWRREPVDQWVRRRAGAVAAPVGVLFEPSPVMRGDLSRTAFGDAVVEALRTWHAPGEFATSLLLSSRLVPEDSADPVADLRSAITNALEAVPVDPAGVQAHEALLATYISVSRTHKAAARRTGMPYGTYRRRMALAQERLVDELRRQAAVSGPAPSTAGSTDRSRPGVTSNR